MNKVVIIDTSIMCCWLNICGKETCGPDNDKWDKQRVELFIKSETDKGATLVLPFPVIIETGNHIAQAAERRYECGVEFVEVITKAVDEKSPWAAFSRQKKLWEGEQIKKLIAVWPEYVKSQKKRNLSMGDLMIKSVADFYAEIGSQVVILTGDRGLKIHKDVDIKVVKAPRRRNNE
ncbi:hypothetical protein JT05_04450 [Desulfosporosinus sp. Tol-M]|jgi:hypothetical protein|nr:hypothetical protein JT05_04450 [Desulfosporosinus sp. Tol-M]